MMAVETSTLPGSTFAYEYPSDVKCRGEHHGQPCGKTIAKNLRGSVDLKCRHCGHAETYEKKSVDTRVKTAYQ